MARTFWWRLGFVGATCLAAASAHAQPTAADKETARAALLDGRAKMAAKDYAGALKSFLGAHAIMGVPTTGLDLARAQEALGQLVEARETALAVMRMPAQAGESDAFAAARKEAEDLAVRLAPRIPSVTIAVRGAGNAAATVRLNGAVLVAATLGLPRKVNPGHHQIAVSAPGFVSETREVDLTEGQTLPVEITLRAGAGPAVTAVTTAAPIATGVGSAAPSAFVTASASATSAPPSSPVPVWAWVANGVAVAAFGVGTAFFVDYIGVRDTVAKDCPNNVCDPAKHDVASAQALRAQWNRDLGVGIGMGVLTLAGAGVAIVGYTRGPAPDAKPSSASVVVRTRGVGVSVEGAF
jgi:hypothetical protein